ncbi:MAG: isocitrate lyase/PEP mutase family protein [Burkholderiales bacterium]
MKTSTLLKTLLAKGEVPMVPAIGTADQAQLCEKTGFKAVLVSGSSVSTQVLGLPDVGLMTMTELAHNVEHICNASNIAALVDCDTGFGNAINVRRTVASMIRCGAAGLFIEDQASPKRCAFVKGKEVISIEEAVGKYKAAIDVRNELDPDFIIMARTDARTAVGGSVEEVIRRGCAYLDAGVDVFYVAGLQSRDEIKAVRGALKDRLRLGLSGSWSAIKPPLTQEELQEFGLCMAHCNLRPIYAIALYDFLMEFRKRGFDFENEFLKKYENHPMGGTNIFAGVFDLSGLPKVAEWEQRYLPPEALARYESSLGLYDPRARGGNN